MSTVQEARLTADDLLAMPDENGFELIDGRLRELRRSMEASWIGGEVIRRLANHIEVRSRAWVFSGGLGIQCFRNDAERVRRPHASIFLLSRMRRLSSHAGYTRISPHLVVEVVSPHDTAYELEEKVGDWLAAGVDEVWVVMPPTRTVTMHRPGESLQIYHEQDEIVACDVAPGFRCQVAEFFPAAVDLSE